MTPEGKDSRPIDMINVALEFKVVESTGPHKESRKHQTETDVDDRKKKIVTAKSGSTSVPRLRSAAATTSTQKTSNKVLKEKAVVGAHSPSRVDTGKSKDESTMHAKVEQDRIYTTRSRTIKTQQTLTVPQSPRFAKRSRFVREPVMSTLNRELLEMVSAHDDTSIDVRLLEWKDNPAAAVESEQLHES